MISEIGINSPRKKLNKNNNNGFTFIEVMITLVVLSLGIVMIYKSLIVSLDRMSYMTSRVYATTILDNRLSEIERMLRIYNALPFETDFNKEVNVGYKKVSFDNIMKIGEVSGYNDIFMLDLSLKWKEGAKDVRISRSTYISDIGISQ